MIKLIVRFQNYLSVILYRSMHSALGCILTALREMFFSTQICGEHGEVIRTSSNNTCALPDQSACLAFGYSGIRPAFIMGADGKLTERWGRKATDPMRIWFSNRSYARVAGLPNGVLTIYRRPGGHI